MGKVELSAYTDADWGNNLDHHRSASGTMIMIRGLWTRAMLKYMGHEQVGATHVWEDNQEVIALVNNAGYNVRDMHVDIKHHFIRENLVRSIVEVQYIPTKDQLVDMLVKGLGTKRLQCLLDASGALAKATQQ
ncbi:polyprotein [Phytophthora megakarya]|uniref:Polyprotein n=1 Tax=Phytophthora megakarya TaxID=4795 RepID=A0A225WEK5_9STRA|nr:polyprotein [Phytophthora megakarya]